MQIGYIPPPKTLEGTPVQPMNDDPAEERRITEDEAQFAVDQGLRDIEVDRWSWPEGVFPNRDAEIARLEEYDIQVSCVGLWGTEYLNPEVANEAEAELERALAYAEDVDADVFVTGTEVPTDLDEATSWEEGVAFYGELIDRIQSRGFTPSFYFGHGHNPLVRDLDDARRFVDELPNATLKVDGANLLLMGIDPKRVLHELGDKVGHFHLKDTLLVNGESVDQCPAGLGDVPWENLINLLYLGDYDGVLSIEPHGSYWGHAADSHVRRQGIQIAKEHIARHLKPEDRPD